MKKIFVVLLSAIFIIMSGMPVFADESFSGWVQGSTIGSLTYWGKTSIEIDGIAAFARAYEYACYRVGSVWHTQELPGGYMWAEADVYEDYHYEGSRNTTNNGYADHVVVIKVKITSPNHYYTSDGRIKAYNWNTGLYTDITELNYSPSLLASSLQSSSCTNSLYSWDGSISNVLLPTRVYDVTDNGETYGTALLSHIAGTLPDWIYAKATNGEKGFVSADDCWTPMPKNPVDAVRNYSTERVRYIPVYAEPGGEDIVGVVDLCYGGSN